MHRYYAQKLLAEIISRNYVFTCKEYCGVKKYQRKLKQMCMFVSFCVYVLMYAHKYVYAEKYIYA